MPVHRRDHSLLILSNGHIGQLVFHYVRKKTFTIGVGSSCDLLINTADPSTAFKSESSSLSLSCRLTNVSLQELGSASWSAVASRQTRTSRLRTVSRFK